jgi:hypothetical protein
MARHAGTDHDLLAMALVGYEAEKAKINAAIGEIRERLGNAAGAPAQAAPKKHTMSAAGRSRIGAAQRKRWAAVKKSQAQAAKAAPPKKRKLSAAGRKAIIAANKKRWAAVRKATAKKTKPVAKAAPKSAPEKAEAATA